MKSSSSLTLCAFLVIGLLLSCSDSGSDPVSDPVISGLQPSTAAVGDTLMIAGSGFGPAKSSSVVTLGTALFTVYTVWSDTEIRGIVPVGSVSGVLTVTVDGRTSNGVSLTITGGGSAVSFSADVQPILTTGCAISGCHRPPSPTSGFDQSTYAGLRAGGVKFGPAVVVAGDSTNSRIIQAMRGIAPGLGRMPFGGPWVSSGVPEANIRTIARWIEEGALDN